MTTSLVPAVFLGTLVFAVINWLKFVRGKDWNAALTQLMVWGSGFAVAWLAAQSQTFGGWAPTGVPLRLLGMADLFFIGLTLGSTPTAGNELLKALDGSNSTVTPHMFPKLVPPRRKSNVDKRAA